MNIRQAIYDWLGSVLLLEPSQSVAGCKFGFAAAWAQRSPLWLWLGLAALVAVAALFYFRFQHNRHRAAVILLFLIRAAVLLQVFLLLAEPVLTATIHSRKRPLLWVLFDGTDSMNIADDLPLETRSATDAATGIQARSASEESGSPGPSRIEYLRALVQKKDKNLLKKFNERFRVQAFLFESTPGVRSLELGRDPRANTSAPYDGKHLAEQMTANGKVTDLGGAMADLAHRNTTGSLAGLIVFSDFNKTSGPDPVKVAGQFGAKIYTVGVGATQAIDVAASLETEPCARTKDEVPVTVVLDQKGLDGQTAHVRLYAERLQGVSGGPEIPGTPAPKGRALIGDKSVVLNAARQSVVFIYKPEQAGQFHLVADVDRLPGEVIEENNHAHGEITVLDDYLRLMFVEYEPTWEWRFIKEVFHRDPLVGMKGFRTFLYSSDPQVRRQNELFLASMAPPRDEFFKNDLIFLGDMPASQPNPALSDRFCKMVKEFVGNMGGGLVILCGPRFGPQQLAKTSLAELLPVVVDPTARIRDQDEFKLRITPRAGEYPFMLLGGGASQQEMQRAWDNLGPLPWYQPVKAIRESANVLAEHPTDTCSDGRKQPLIAIRQYGRGEVVYLAFDQTWRLRRGHGEELYRKFWKEVMWRLALNHALGAEKRFVVRTDRKRFPIDETVTLKVDAYNDQYQVLAEKDLINHRLDGQWISPAAGGEKPVTRPLSLTQVRPGEPLYETRFVATVPGEHRVRVVDPVTHNPVEWTFTVFSTPVERQSPTRNDDLQRSIAAESGGTSCDIKDVDKLLDEIKSSPRTETSIAVVSLINTWACFIVVVGLLIAEWLLRKRIGLS